MENLIQKKESATSDITLESSAILKHWQGHRGLTRRMIQSFPEDKLFHYSIGGMRPFSAMVMELIGIASPGIQGMLSGEWQEIGDLSDDAQAAKPETKEQLLKLWDDVTEKIDLLWPQIPPHRFLEVDVAFGQYENPVYKTLFYFIDNEVHHRGQGYVYLRSLGIEPPPFWDRD